jgi:RNA polymerase nonessential primary-like sigma factor
MRQDIQKILADLSPQEQRILSLRFGLEDGKEKSLAQIGQKLNLSRERVRQLESRALDHLRRKHALELREYLAS